MNRIETALHTGWQLHTLGRQDWQPARVPGTVYTTLVDNGVIPDPYWRDNAESLLDLMEQDYEYRTVFSLSPQQQAMPRHFLRFEGIDTVGEVFLNGCSLGKVCNMHRTWEFPVTGLLQPADNVLTVRLDSPLRYIREAFRRSPMRGADDAMDGFVHLRKAHCMFGWDWGAHLPDAGLFRPVVLVGADLARFTDVHLRQVHRDGRVTLTLAVQTDGPQPPRCRVTVLDPDGTPVATAEGSDALAVEVPNPRLWWPNGLGDQPLYRVQVALLQGEECLDRWEKRIGLRTLTVSREADAWGEGFAHCVNGVKVFAMGADYIPEDHLLGRTSPERTRRLLADCKAAHFNCIRVWGGGYYPEDWFFDCCDEFGLMVWQDFMFACGTYELTPAFEANVRAEFADNIRRLRDHASLALWCGNNEMEMFTKSGEWGCKPSQARDYLFLFERVIPEELRRWDPDRFYWPASPSSGGSFDEPNDPNRGDVHYWDVWHGNKPFSEYRKFFFRYVSEFGFQSFPCLSTVKTFTVPQDRNIFSYIMERHQRNGQANGKILNYLQQTYRYPGSFDNLLYASQMLQADAIRYGVEHFRRNRGRCMGAIYWQLNDCWPVASWSSIDYTGRWKALHYAAARFFAPVLLSCEEEGWINEETPMNWQHFAPKKSVRFNLSNETRHPQTVTVRWMVRQNTGEILRSTEQTVTVAPLSALWLDKVALPELDERTQYVSYEAEQDGRIFSEGTVLLSLPKYFQYKDPHLQCKVEGDRLTVTADAYARGVEIRNEDETLRLSDNYFDLNGGSKTVRILSGDPGKLRCRSVYDIGREEMPDEA